MQSRPNPSNAVNATSLIRATLPATSSGQRSHFFILGDPARQAEIARSELPAQRRDAEAVDGRCQRPQTLSGEAGDERADGEVVAVGEEGVVGGGDEVARWAF